VGNLSKYLPFILDNMSKNPKRQLLLLQAIKEIVSGQSSAGANSLRLSLSSSIGGTAAQDIAVHLDTLLPILFQHASSEDDLTRNAVSECLGRLAKISPERIVTEISKRGTDDKSAFARGAMVHALRYAVTERPSVEVDALLTKAYATAAAAIADEDIHVRLAGLQVFFSFLFFSSFFFFFFFFFFF
jgi:cullin-associated NEDD8-dissociated protein 1